MNVMLPLAVACHCN